MRCDNRDTTKPAAQMQHQAKLLAVLQERKDRQETLNTLRRRAWPVVEACHQLGIGRTSLYEMATRGEIKFIKIAGRTLVPDSEIERLTSVGEAV